MPDERTTSQWRTHRPIVRQSTMPGSIMPESIVPQFGMPGTTL